jgi:hypothetical protein
LRPERAVGTEVDHEPALGIVVAEDAPATLRPLKDVQDAGMEDVVRPPGQQG